jgi:tetratricopeptide (TPR) repeat protein
MRTDMNTAVLRILLPIVLMTPALHAQGRAVTPLEITVVKAASPAAQYSIARDFRGRISVADRDAEALRFSFAAIGNLDAIPRFWPDAHDWVALARLEQHQLYKWKGYSEDADRILEEAVAELAEVPEYCKVAIALSEQLILKEQYVRTADILLNCEEKFGDVLPPQEQQAVLWRLAFVQERMEMVDEAVALYRRIMSEAPNSVGRAEAAVMAVSVAIRYKRPYHGLLTSAEQLLRIAERDGTLREEDREKLRALRHSLPSND